MRRLFAVCAALLLATPAWAQSPVRVTADNFVVDQSTSLATFTGNVVVVRTDLTVWADKVVVEYGEGGVEDIDSMVATGHVRLKTSDQDATGERATFDPDAQVLRLTGNVKVVNSAGTLSGPELTINLAEGTTVFSSQGGGRVTGVFTPQ